MRRLILLTLSWLIAVAPAAWAQDSDADLLQVFSEGNAAYEAGDYPAAIARYESLVAAGIDDPAVYYNAGNAFYRSQDLGHAVLYYERALRLVPRDKGIRENLELVESQLIDKQFVDRGNRFVRAAVYLHDNLSALEMYRLSASSYLLLCVLGILFVFRDRRVIDNLYHRLSVLSPGRLVGLSRTQDMIAMIALVGFLFATTAVSATAKHLEAKNRTRAVIVAEEVAVYSGPTRDATLEFKLHEGTRVSIEQDRSGWAKVRLPGGLDGWVEAAATKRI